MHRLIPQESQGRQRVFHKWAKLVYCIQCCTKGEAAGLTLVISALRSRADDRR